MKGSATEVTTGVPYDEAKFRETLLYVARGLEDDPAGGALKMNKAMFAAECACVRCLGRPLTGAQYQRLRNGPAPRRLLPVREALIGGGHAELVEERHMGFPLKRLRALREPDVSLFTDEELKILDQAISYIKGITGTKASELSHQEVGWQLADDGETIPVETALLSAEVHVTPAIALRLAELEARYI